MMVVYLDTSAAVRAIQGDESALDLLEGASRLVASRLTELELHRVLVRVEVSGELAADDLERAHARSVDLMQQVELLPIDPVVDRARERFPSEPVRCLDAIHLATLAQVGRDIRGPLAVCTFDARMRENAKRMGFAVLPGRLSGSTTR